jgi:repressor LexA
VRDPTGAGLPFEIREVSETFSIPLEIMRRKNVYVLQVKGNAMIGDHLHDGDLLILEKRNSPQDGEMVLVRTGYNGAALRSFFCEGHRIRLEPACPSCQAIVCSETEVVIEGVVVGILRKYGD